MLKKIIFLLNYFFALALHAQVMPFTHYSIKDGLIDNNVQAIMRDDRGLLWVGTDFGIYWFDGKQFYTPPLKTNVGQLLVNSFYKDRKGVIWVLTYFNGIYKYQDGRFSNFPPDSLVRDISSNTVSSMLQVTAGSYAVIIDGTPYLFDERTFSLLDPDNILLHAKTIGFTQLNDETLLVNTEFGIFIYHLEKGKFKLTDHILKERLVSRVLLMEKQLWVATSNGILVFANNEESPFAKTPVIYLSGKAIKNIVADKNGNIWALADSVFKIGNGNIIAYGTTNGLPLHIQDIYCDNEGLTWFAHRKGISMLGDEYYSFTSLKNGNQELLLGPINTDAQNNIWIGTSDGLLKQTVNGYQPFKKAGTVPIGYVTSLCKNVHNELLAATSEGIFSITDKGINKIHNIHASAITVDVKGRIWFAADDGHIWMVDQDHPVALHSDHFNDEMVTGLNIQQNKVWIGYRGSGIRKYLLKGDSLLLHREFGASTGFPDIRVRSCVTDKTGNILFGTRTNGVFIFSSVTDSLLAHITTQNGLTANWIKDMYCDTDGTLYLATNHGVNILRGDYHNPELKQLNINNDNINRETNDIVKKENVFYFSTNEGVLKWMPGNMQVDTTAPPVYFTHVNIQGHAALNVDPYTRDAGSVTLPYWQHVISFEFAGISLKNPERVRYRYMLEGQNKEWSQPTEYNAVSFNLEPGDYTFRVIAVNANGKTSAQPAVFHFIIAPPFWSTGWFIAACVVLVLLIAYFIYRYKINQLLQLEALRNKISTDLHDDIGSTLSSISILSTMALKEPPGEPMLNMIRGISENSTSLLEKMDDIVWSINPRNDTLENLIIRFRRFASVLLEAANIDYNIEVSDNIKNLKLPMNNRQHIYLILKEAINNLIKYSNCNKANIVVVYRHKLLELTVQDNGIGFDSRAEQYGNGIINMQQRARQMDAHINIESQPGAGTSITLSLKIK